LGEILINFTYDEMIWLIVYHAVVNYDYDRDLVVSIVTIGDLPTIDAQISMNARHYCVDYCIYSTTIGHYHGTMARCRLHHHHQAHCGILRADHPGHSVCESGHILTKLRQYLVVCHSDQI